MRWKVIALMAIAVALVTSGLAPEPALGHSDEPAQQPCGYGIPNPFDRLTACNPLNRLSETVGHRLAANG